MRSALRLAAFSMALGCSAAGSTPRALGDGTEAALADDRDVPAPFTEQERAQSRGKLGGVWMSCFRGFSPDADAASSLSRLIGFCSKPTGMAPVAPARTGETQTAQDPVERFTFFAHQGRCYRVFAVGSAEITDLDVALLDPSGRAAAFDTTHERWAVVPARGPLCVSSDGVYTVELSVVAGSGSTLLQVVGDSG